MTGRDETSSKGSVRAFIALGSNVGDRIGHLRYAVGRLRDHKAIRVRRLSSVYETEAHTSPDGPDAPPFLNAVAEVETGLTPSDLLSFCLAVERERGRNRTDAGGWTPRTLDLDLLMFGDETLSTTDLTIPHPRLAERRFVLRPLADVASDVCVPEPFGATVRDLLEACRDTGWLRRTAWTLDDRRDEPDVT